MTQLLLAGENLPWSLCERRGVGFLILSLFLKISGFFPWGSTNNVCRMDEFTQGKSRSGSSGLTFPVFAPECLDPRFVQLLGFFSLISFHLIAFSRIIGASCLQLVP